MGSTRRIAAFWVMICIPGPPWPHEEVAIDPQDANWYLPGRVACGDLHRLTSTLIMVPLPGSLLTVSFPPISAAWSCMEGKPMVPP